MSKPISFGKIEVNIVSTMEKTHGAPEPETPFRIAILGDYSGRANRGIVDPALDNRRILMVDRDNLDEILAKLKVNLKSRSSFQSWAKNYHLLLSDFPNLMIFILTVSLKDLKSLRH